MKLWSVIWLLLFSTWNFYFSRTTFSVKRLAKYASALSGGFLIGKILCDMYRNINPKLRRKVRIPTKNLNQQIWSTVPFSRFLVFRTLKVYFFIIIWGFFLSHFSCHGLLIIHEGIFLLILLLKNNSTNKYCSSVFRNL